MATTPVPRIAGPPMSAAEFIAEDERRLSAAQPVVRAALLTDRSVSLGVGQRSDSPSARRAQSCGVPVVRRSSGGLGLLHAPGDVLWSVVLPRGDPLVGRDFTCAYPRLGAGVVDALGELGITASWADPLSLPGTEYCLLGPRGRVLLAGGRALGGAAQHLTRNALLHQGVVAARLDLSALQEIFGITAAVATRQLTSMSALGTSVDAAVVKRIVDGLGRSIDAGQATAL
ncbi:MAG: hypothetical protein L3J96_03670 [Thermoplasmata archaeon]|nr:hypothetical protein [Thermoplasmata archaeon]